MTNVKIHCGDYHDSQEFIDRNTFVYFDPPYRPLTTSSSFTSYTKDGFNDKEQEELAEYVKYLAGAVNAKVLVSNSDPHNTNPNDDFFDELYAPLKIERVYASRIINSKAENRKPITELLIYY